MSQQERDKRSLKCEKCGGFIMLGNSITWLNNQGQYRPVPEILEDVTLKGHCILCQKAVSVSASLVLRSSTQPRKEEQP